MSSWCFSEPFVVLMHYPFKRQCLCHWDMGWWHRGSLLNTRFQQLKFPETIFSLHKTIPRSHCSVWTWWKLQWGAPFSPDTTNPGKEYTWQQWVSARTSTEWASHRSSPKRSKKSTLKCHQVWENQLLHYCNGVTLTKQLSQRSFPILIMLQF